MNGHANMMGIAVKRQRPAKARRRRYTWLHYKTERAADRASDALSRAGVDHVAAYDVQAEAHGIMVENMTKKRVKEIIQAHSA